MYGNDIGESLSIMKLNINLNKYLPIKKTDCLTDW